MKILVAGGAGFIGRNLCRSLLLDGHDVLVVDNFLTGQFELALKQYLRFDVLRHDIVHPLPLTRGSFDRIYNLACPASPPAYQRDPVHTLLTSVQGAYNLLALATPGTPILQASTSEIYGDPLEHPQRETYLGNVNPVGRRSCYDESKRCAETLFYEYHRLHSIPARIGRIFNCYGTGMAPDDGRMVPNFVQAALKGEPLKIYGTGLQTRSLCYIDDMTKGLIALMEKGPSGEPVNLGNPVEYTVKEIAERIIELTASKSKIEYAPKVPDDPARRCPDITKARVLLNWQPTVQLTEGLERTIAYFRG